LEAVTLEGRALGGAVAGVGEGLIDLEMVAPAGELDALVAEIGRFAGHLVEFEVRPLAGEQGDKPSHAPALPCVSDTRQFDANEYFGRIWGGVQRGGARE
jgi:hypothetical protein